MTVENPTAPATEATTTDEHGVDLSEAASSKAKALLDQEGRDDMRRPEIPAVLRRPQPRRRPLP
jgi:hypothetical protein